MNIFKPKFKVGQVLIKNEEFAIHHTFPFLVVEEVGKKDYLYHMEGKDGYVGTNKYTNSIDYIDSTHIEYSKDEK